MTYKTKDLERGEQRGFTWFKLQGAAGDAFHFAFPPGCKIPEEVSFGNSGCTVEGGPFPFEDGLMEEKKCMRDRHLFSEFDWESWIEEHIGFPKGCSIKLNIAQNGWIKKNFHIEAETYRRGRVETVSRRIDGSRDIFPQIREAFAYFERNCPAPTDEERSRIAISEIGANLMGLMKKQGTDLIRKWHSENEEKDKTEKRYGYHSVSVDGVLIRAQGIQKVTIERHVDHRQLLVEIVFDAGHTYKEDEKGATYTVKGEYAESIVIGAKGRSLDKYVNIPGSEGQVIRTARMEHDEETPGRKTNPRMKLRTTVPTTIFEIPETSDDSDKEVMDDLKALFGPDGYFVTAEASVVPFLKGMDMRTLREALSVLKSSQNVFLREYSGHEVTLKSPGGHISIDYAKHEKLPDPATLYGEAA